MACGSCWTRPRRCRWRCSPPCCSAGARCPSACSGWSATCAMAAVAAARRRHERPGPMSATERPASPATVRLLTWILHAGTGPDRSAESRVGKECCGMVSCLLQPYHTKKKSQRCVEGYYRLLINCVGISVICVCCDLFFFKQKTAYEVRISDWSSDVCSSDLGRAVLRPAAAGQPPAQWRQWQRQGGGMSGPDR